MTWLPALLPMVPVALLCVYLAKILWWDHRAANARLKRSKELGKIIQDPDSTKAERLAAGAEMFGVEICE